MSRPQPSASWSDRQASLAPEVEGLLVDVVADGFVLYCCGPRAAPHALIASYQWDHYLDVLTIRDFDEVTAARVPTRAKVDVFAPEVVVWAYQGPPQQALRALLNLVHPAHPDAPTTEYPAPPSLHIPRAEQRPMTIRLPSSGRALARATRLAAGLTAHDDDLAMSATVPSPQSRITPDLFPAVGRSFRRPERRKDPCPGSRARSRGVSRLSQCQLAWWCR